MRTVLVLVVTLVLLLLTACSAGAPDDSNPTTPSEGAGGESSSPLTWVLTPTTELELPDGYQADIVATGLENPTQMIIGPDGWLWVAQLAGLENDGAGQVVALSPSTGERRLLLDTLFKPTGLAVLDGYVWVAAGQDLVRAPLHSDGTVGEVEVVLNDLPYNNRSNGTLITSPEGKLVYSTSTPPSAVEELLGQGTLWELNPANPTESERLAAGFALAYAYTYDEAGRLWVTNITNDIIDGVLPPDALEMVLPKGEVDGTQCFFYSDPAEHSEEIPDFCATHRLPVMFFPAHTTPTSVVFSPWEEDTLLIALWLTGEVVRAPVTLEGDNATGEWDSFIGGLENPQHLLLPGDGSLLVSDYLSGIVYRISKVGEGG